MKRKTYLIIVIAFLFCSLGCVTSKLDDSSKISDIQRAQNYNAALNRVLDYGAPSKYKIEYLLSLHDFKTLDKWFEAMLQQYKQDAQYEGYLDQGYAAFNQNNISLHDLDAWVAATDSYISYTARGIFKAKQGFDARGSKFASQTRADQISEMQRYHDEAAKDLQMAISRNPTIIPAYVFLIKMATSSNMSYSQKDILQKAEENDKRTYSVRFAYMASLDPKWGGSLEKMSDFSKRLVPFADLNPRLWALQSETYRLRAFDLHREKNYAAALELYTAALKFGDNPKIFTLRASCYSALGQEELSRADLKKFRDYAARDTSDSVPGTLTDMAGSKFEISENTSVDSLINIKQSKKYLVLPVDQLVPWADGYADVSSRIARRNMDRIDLILMKLGSESVDRSQLNAILNERKISTSNINSGDAQTLGKLMSADVVVITTMPKRGTCGPQSYCEDLNIKAVLASTGKVCWQSSLKGSVVPDASVPYYFFELIYFSIESKLYDSLEQKLQQL